MAWLRRAGLRRMDAYAHHPYYGHRTEKPTTVPKSKKAVTMANIGLLIKQVNRQKAEAAAQAAIEAVVAAKAAAAGTTSGSSNGGESAAETVQAG